MPVDMFGNAYAPPLSPTPEAFAENEAAAAAQAPPDYSVLGNPANGSGVASGAAPRRPNVALLVVVAVAVWFFFLK